MAKELKEAKKILEKGEMKFGHLLAHRNLPLDFSYGGVACELSKFSQELFQK